MARDRKRWFRMADSILHETWPIEIKGVAACLLAYLNTRWQREGLTSEEACYARLSPAAAMLVTGSQRLTKARSMLGRLSVYTSLTVGIDGVDTLVLWPKFSETQGFAVPQKPPPNPTPIRSDPDPDSSSLRSEEGSGPEEDPDSSLRSLPAEPGATAEPLAADSPPPAAEPPPPEPWRWLAPMLLARSARSSPPPLADEVEAWLDERWPEIDAAAEAEACAANQREPTAREIHARVKRIAHSRWHAYLATARPHRGTRARIEQQAKRDAFKRSAGTPPAWAYRDPQSVDFLYDNPPRRDDEAAHTH